MSVRIKGFVLRKNIVTLSHTKWRCQYHIVFAPKYRRMVIYREIKADIGRILRPLDVEIIEADTRVYKASDG